MERKTDRLDNRVDELDAVLNNLLRLAGDQAVKLVVLVLLAVTGTTLPLLNRTLSTNRDPRSRLTLHLLKRVTTRTNEQSEEVDLGELLDGDVDLVRGSTGRLTLRHEVLGRRTERRVELHLPVDEAHPLIFETLAVAHFAGVGAASVGVVGRRRGGGTSMLGRDDLPGTERALDLVETELDCERRRQYSTERKRKSERTRILLQILSLDTTGNSSRHRRTLRLVSPTTLPLPLSRCRRGGSGRTTRRRGRRRKTSARRGRRKTAPSTVVVAAVLLLLLLLGRRSTVVEAARRAAALVVPSSSSSSPLITTVTSPSSTAVSSSSSSSTAVIPSVPASTSTTVVITSRCSAVAVGGRGRRRRAALRSVAVAPAPVCRQRGGVGAGLLAVAVPHRLSGRVGRLFREWAKGRGNEEGQHNNEWGWSVLENADELCRCSLRCAEQSTHEVVKKCAFEADERNTSPSRTSPSLETTEKEVRKRIGTLRRGRGERIQSCSRETRFKGGREKERRKGRRSGTFDSNPTSFKRNEHRLLLLGVLLATVLAVSLLLDVFLLLVAVKRGRKSVLFRGRKEGQHNVHACFLVLLVLGNKVDHVRLGLREPVGGGERVS
jgi:hypothetical protein